MKRIFICMAAIVASLACSVSCSKDDSDEQPVDVKEQIAEAVNKASLPVCDMSGNRVGVATFLESRTGRVCVAMKLMGHLDPAIRNAFMIPGRLHEFLIDDVQMVEEGIAITWIEPKVVELNDLQIKALPIFEDNVAVGEGRRFMVRTTDLGKAIRVGVVARDVLEVSKVEENLAQYKGENFMTFVKDKEIWGVEGISKVCEIQSDGRTTGITLGIVVVMDVVQGR